MDPLLPLWVTAAAAMVGWTAQRASLAAAEHEDRSMQEAAKRLRLNLVGPELRGTLDKVQIRVRKHAADRRVAGAYAQVEALLPISIPSAFVIESFTGDAPRGKDPNQRVKTGSSLDRQMWARGEELAARKVLKDPDVSRQVAAFLEEGCILDIDHRRVRISHAGHAYDVEPGHLERAVHLASSVTRSWIIAWANFAAENELTLTPDGNRIHGWIQGHHIDIRQSRNRKGGLCTRITCDLAMPLPSGLRLCHVDWGPADAIPHDRDVSPLLWGGASVPEALTRLLDRPNVRLAVEAVVVQNPGSTITDRNLTLRVDGRASQLTSLVETALVCVQTLAPPVEADPHEAGIPSHSGA